MAEANSSTFLTASDFLTTWIGHRQLTRRVLAAFPENELFSFSIGGMRTAAEFAVELLQVGLPVVRGLTTGEWSEFQMESHASKEELLAAWDADLAAIEQEFGGITQDQLAAVHVAFGMYSSSGKSHVVYALDNEVHHRAQMYVYLRALDIEPPAFFERQLIE